MLCCWRCRPVTFMFTSCIDVLWFLWFVIATAYLRFVFFPSSVLLSSFYNFAISRVFFLFVLFFSFLFSFSAHQHATNHHQPNNHKPIQLALVSLARKTNQTNSKYTKQLYLSVPGSKYHHAKEVNVTIDFVRLHPRICTHFACELCGVTRMRDCTTHTHVRASSFLLWTNWCDRLIYPRVSRAGD